MSQHDYVIDNQSGANFRSDLNSVLQAIATLNSGATEPATPYANMWWYDTTAGVLKQRNSGNSAWLPLMAFGTDGQATISVNSTAAALTVTQIGAGNALVVEDSTNPDSTPLVVDANGNLIRGATQTYASVAAISATTPSFQTHGTSLGTASVGQFAWNNTTAYLLLSKAGAGAFGTHAIVTDGSTIGAIQFNGSDGTQFVGAATILSTVDGTPSAGVIPGNLRFLVADSTGTRIERLRLGPGGQFGIGGATYGTSGQALCSGGASSPPYWGYPVQLFTASGAAPSYSARAWVNFNGTGTVAIRASGNVSSITDNGVGAYTVNFSTAMDDANYAVLATGGDLASTNYQVVQVSNAVAPTTSAVRIQGLIQNSGNPTADDQERVSVTIFR